METLDRAEEWRRLFQHYRQMSDDELLELARKNSELTDVAQQAPAYVIAQRGLKPQADKSPAPPDPAPPDNSPYAADRELVELCRVWSLADALQLQTLLDRAGIPFFMGPENATGVDAVTSRAMQNYVPADEPGPKQDEELGDAPIRCPKCLSKEVIFEALVTAPATIKDNSSPRYKWTCDYCGHHWEDDGIAKET